LARDLQRPEESGKVYENKRCSVACIIGLFAKRVSHDLVRDFLLPAERWDESVHEEHEIFCCVYYRALLQKESNIIGPICGNRHVVRDLLLPEERWSAGCVYQKHTKRCSVAYIIVLFCGKSPVS